MARIDLSQMDDFRPDFNETIQDGEFAVWDNDNKYFVPGKPVFGSQYQRYVELSNTTTSGTAWITHQSFTTPVLPAGKYMIQWQFTWSNEEEKDTRLEVRVRANGDDLYETNFEQSMAGKDFNDRNISTAFNEYDIASDETINILMEMRRQDKNERVRIYNSQFIIYRIS